MTIPNPVAAVVALLRATPDVADAVGSVTLYEESVPFIIGGRLRDDMISLMPRRCIVVREAGSIRRAMSTPLQTASVDIFCYGQDPDDDYDASELGYAVHGRLQSMSPARVNNAAILSATLVGGPTPGEEPEVGWMFSLRTYNVLISEVEQLEE